MAAPRPQGMATRQAQNVTMSVPRNSGTAPNWPSRKSGVQVVPVMKSQGEFSMKNSIAGLSSEKMMANVVMTETKAAVSRAMRTMSSP